MKLVVGGCSFSDWYPGVEKPWSVKLSERMKLEYLHEARGCGSNYRIWRELTNHIVQGKVSKEDIILIQYTSPTRYEFWSDCTHPVIPITSYKNSSDPFYNNRDKRDGTIIRWKPGAYEFNSLNNNEKEFFKELETHFIHQDFCNQQFLMYQNMFHGFLLSRGFNKFFYLYPYQDTIGCEWAGLDRIIIKKEDWYIPNFCIDIGHLNDSGVEHLANLVYDRIKDLV